MNADTAEVFGEEEISERLKDILPYLVSVFAVFGVASAVSVAGWAVMDVSLQQSVLFALALTGLFTPFVIYTKYK